MVKQPPGSEMHAVVSLSRGEVQFGRQNLDVVEGSPG